MTQRVYFARCIGPHGTAIGAVKIGCSYNHDARLRAVAANLPFTLELIGTVPGGMNMEAMIHLYLRKHRISGEYFHENQYVSAFIETAVARDKAFYYIDDQGVGDSLPPQALEAFMKFHGITLEMACEYLGRDPKAYAGKMGWTKNRKLISAAMILAQKDCRFVAWPRDCILGLLGQVHANVTPSLPEPQRQAA